MAVPDFQSWFLPLLKRIDDGESHAGSQARRGGKKVGYEINFNRYFYKYTSPWPLEEIQADIQVIEKDILTMLREVAG